MTPQSFDHEVTSPSTNGCDMGMDHAAVGVEWTDSSTEVEDSAVPYMPPEGFEFDDQESSMKKNHRYDKNKVWPCRATQLTPDWSKLLPGEPRVLDIEMIAVQLRDTNTLEAFYQPVVGRASVLNMAGEVVYDVYAAYPAKGKVVGNHEITRKGFPPSKFMVEVPDTWYENGAQPAKEVERNLKDIFADSDVIVWDQSGDTKCYLFENRQTMFTDNGANVIDAQMMYNGLHGAKSLYQPSLACASRLVLGWNPQDDGNHDPRKDADATRELYLRQSPFDRAGHEAQLRADGWRPERSRPDRPFADRRRYTGGRSGIEAAANEARGIPTDPATLATQRQPRSVVNITQITNSNNEISAGGDVNIINQSGLPTPSAITTEQSISPASDIRAAPVADQGKENIAPAQPATDGPKTWAAIAGKNSSDTIPITVRGSNTRGGSRGSGGGFNTALSRGGGLANNDRGASRGRGAHGGRGTPGGRGTRGGGGRGARAGRGI